MGDPMKRSRNNYPFGSRPITGYNPNNRNYHAQKKCYQDLVELENKLPNEVLFALKNKQFGFKTLINALYLEDKQLLLTLNLLTKACASNHEENLRNFLLEILRDCSNFFNINLVKYIRRIQKESLRKTQPEAMSHVLDLLNGLTIFQPEKSKPIIQVLMPLVTEVIANVPHSLEKNELSDRLKMLMEKVKTINEQSTLVCTALVKINNPENFRGISVFPDVRELTAYRRPFLRKIIVEGRYPNVDEYLDTHYRLLREDFVRPLREGITSLINQSATSRDIKVYRHVTIKNALVTNEGVVYQVHFDLNFNSQLKNIRWDSSKRLIYGNLVCLTFDDFNTLYFGTVGNRDTNLLKCGLIEVKFENCNDILRIRWKNFVMVESEAYFEASRYVLSALQNIEESTFPLKEYIVEVQKEVSSPEYLSKNTVYCMNCLTQEYNHKMELERLKNKPAMDISKIQDIASGTCICKCNNQDLIVTVLNKETWPKKEDLNLDESQEKALRMALTKKLAIIQGPPGTGKTYVGLKIMQVLLHNKHHWTDTKDSTSPIVIVCYTNHALDQFLEGVLQLTNKIVRVGGRSSSSKLQPYCMGNLKRNNNRNPRADYMAGHFRDVKKELENSLKLINEKDKQLKRSGKIILSEAVLRPVIDEKQYESLTTEAPSYLNLSKDKVGKILPYWLGIQLPSHVMNYHHTNEEKAWIVERNSPEYSTKAKNFLPAFTGPTRSTDNRGKVYEFKKYTDLMNKISNENSKKIINTGTNEEVNGTDKSMETIISKIQTNLVINGTLQEREMNNTSDKPMNVTLFKQMSGTSEKPTNVTLFKQMSGTSEKPTNGTSSKRITIGTADRLSPDQVDSKEVDRITAERQEITDDTDVTIVNLHEDDTEEYFKRLGNGDDLKIKGVMKHEEKMIAENLKNFKILSESEMESLKKNNIWSLKVEDKWRLYKTWHYLYNVYIREELEDLRKDYERKLQAFREIRIEEEVLIARSALVIGLTTSGAAKYRHFLQNLCSKIVVVEEAAEVLEAQVITSLSKHTEHLILIGDHQQLRPNPVVYDLVVKYHLDISLFERLIGNELPYVTLNIQHRMKPCISSLLVPNIYKELKDHPCVTKYEEIKGFEKSMFFLNHDSFEKKDKDSTSRANTFEAEFVVALCQYILMQGYQQSQITILTTYQGQLFLIRRLMPKNLDVKATVVDNYQGEENDIILLSFVRSNENGIIGFLKTANRVCVALSRAKMGLYCVGNFDLLANHSELWRNIRNDLLITSSIGKELKLVCQLHQNGMSVCKASDFLKIPNGGCELLCDFSLECGHKCVKKCHTLEQDHKALICKMPCQRIICDLNHRCKKRCFEDCGTCTVQVPKLIKSCDHEILISCKNRDLDVSCDKPCSLHIACGHPCSGICGQPCGICLVKVRVELSPCGHKVLTQCYKKDVVKCTAICCKPLLCGHNCSNGCGEICGPCRIIVKATGLCGHFVNVSCSLQLNQEQLSNYCEEKCERILPCMHQCRNKCSTTCTTYCNELVNTSLPCGHPIQIECSNLGVVNLSEYMTKCLSQCQAPLDCGHLCTGTCGSCFQGRLHIPCRNKCERYLVCGHACQELCSASCPPCRQICQNRCFHTQCQQMCGFPCVPCFEKCERQCEHKRCENHCLTICDEPPCVRPCNKRLFCGHFCTGICGQICPFICRHCHWDHILETSSSTRFYQLEDCGHLFGLTEIAACLQYQMSSAIHVLLCPYCFKPIRRSLYFREVVKMNNLNVERVKMSIFNRHLLDVDGEALLKTKLEELSILPTKKARTNSLITKPVSYMKEFTRHQGALSHAILVLFGNNVEILRVLIDIELSLGTVETQMSQDVSLRKLFNDVSSFFFAFVSAVSARMTDPFFCGSSQVNNDILREISRLRVATYFLVNFGKIYRTQDVYFQTCFQRVFDILIFIPFDDETTNRQIEYMKQAMIEVSGCQPEEQNQSKTILLHEPMGFALGNWHICPNDHINYIPSSLLLLDKSAWPECKECNVRII